MSYFLSLPPEIRNMIYEYCLVVGKVYPLFSKLSWETYGYDKTLREHRVPDTALLTASKQVNLETETILYSRNTFVMPVLEDMVKLFKQYLRTPRRNALLWIRSVEVAFHPYDLSRTERKGILRAHYFELMRDVLTMRPVSQFNLNDVGYELHDGFCKGLTDSAWVRKATLLTRNLRLHKLWIFLDEAWCICDCCCLEDDVVECLSDGFLHGLPSVIGIEGVVELEREEDMRAHIVAGQEAYEEERVRNENGPSKTEKGAEEEEID